jgi:hypothetical protein
MRRVCRALASLAMGVTLAAATTAAAPAMPSTGTQDPHDQLAQREALYQSELERNLQLRNQRLRESLAERDQLVQRLALGQSEPEHNLATARAARVIAAQPAARTDSAASSPGVDVFATLLLGLVGACSAVPRPRSAGPPRPADGCIGRLPAPEPVPKV